MGSLFAMDLQNGMGFIHTTGGSRQRWTRTRHLSITYRRLERTGQTELRSLSCSVMPVIFGSGLYYIYFFSFITLEVSE